MEVTPPRPAPGNALVLLVAALYSLQGLQCADGINQTNTSSDSDSMTLSSGAESSPAEIIPKSLVTVIILIGAAIIGAAIAKLVNCIHDRQSLQDNLSDMSKYTHDQLKKQLVARSFPKAPFQADDKAAATLKAEATALKQGKAWSQKAPKRCLAHITAIVDSVADPEESRSGIPAARGDTLVAYTETSAMPVTTNVISTSCDIAVVSETEPQSSVVKAVAPTAEEPEHTQGRTELKILVPPKQLSLSLTSLRPGMDDLDDNVFEDIDILESLPYGNRGGGKQYDRTSTPVSANEFTGVPPKERSHSSNQNESSPLGWLFINTDGDSIVDIAAVHQPLTDRSVTTSGGSSCCSNTGSLTSIRYREPAETLSNGGFGSSSASETPTCDRTRASVFQTSTPTGNSTLIVPVGISNRNEESIAREDSDDHLVDGVIYNCDVAARHVKGRKGRTRSGVQKPSVNKAQKYTMSRNIASKTGAKETNIKILANRPHTGIWRDAAVCLAYKKSTLVALKQRCKTAGPTRSATHHFSSQSSGQ